MEKKLSEAALKGSVDSLHQILQEDPLILHTIVVQCISQTPLHTASILGHSDFVNVLLTQNRQLASELDSFGNSPLHLASAKGHAEIARSLLTAGPEMCSVRNSGGRTPVHVAAVKGRVDVLRELVRVVPESTRSLTDRGETVLHLCVKHNRLEVLKLLLLSELMKKESELVNLKDCDGNTILHIAVANKQIEIVNFLLSINGVEVNALNTNNSTALDILTQSPRDLGDMELEDSLKRAGALSSKDLHLITNEWVPSKVPQITNRLASKVNTSENPAPKHKHTDWLGRKRSALMVVASLIATVAFQAAITPPGGVWQDDYQVDDNGNPVAKPHKVGESVMAYTEPIVYGQFMILNTIAFLSSLSIILLLVSGLPMRRRRWMWVQMIITWIAITAQVMTYFISLRNMSPKVVGVRSTLREVTQISVLTWLCLMAVVFIGNIIRANKWIRSYRLIKEEERGSLAAKVDDQEEFLDQ